MTEYSQDLVITPVIDQGPATVEYRKKENIVFVMRYTLDRWQALTKEATADSTSAIAADYKQNLLLQRALEVMLLPYRIVQDAIDLTDQKSKRVISFIAEIGRQAKVAFDSGSPVELMGLFKEQSKEDGDGLEGYIKGAIADLDWSGM